MKRSLLDIDIDLSKVDTTPRLYSTVLDDLLEFHPNTRKVKVITYSLNASGVASLKQFNSFRCIYSVSSAPIEPSSFIKQLDAVHTKLYILDSHVYVGSANLTGNTIGNLMIKASKAQAKKLIKLFDEVWNIEQYPKTALILL